MLRHVLRGIQPHLQLSSRRIWSSVPLASSRQAFPATARRLLTQDAATKSPASESASDLEASVASSPEKDAPSASEPIAEEAGASGDGKLASAVSSSPATLKNRMSRAHQRQEHAEVLALHSQLLEAGDIPSLKTLNIVLEAKATLHGVSQGLEMLQARLLGGPHGRLCSEPAYD